MAYLASLAGSRPDAKAGHVGRGADKNAAGADAARSGALTVRDVPSRLVMLNQRYYSLDAIGGEPNTWVSVRTRHDSADHAPTGSAAATAVVSG